MIDSLKLGRVSGQGLLALAAAVWRNWAINAPDKRSLIAYERRG
jgi:hypothetical protein